MRGKVNNNIKIEDFDHLIGRLLSGTPRWRPVPIDIEPKYYEGKLKKYHSSLE